LRNAIQSNPFSFGALALDDAFTDRQAEIKELVADARNGQDVVIYAPRRYGKTSLVWRVAQQLVRRGALVAHVDLMTTPTRAKLAEKLARTIHEDVASRLFRAKERLSVFSGLRVRPQITISPEDASASFAFESAAPREDLDATLERLLELPAQLAAERKKLVVMVLDEFQEIVEIDPALPKLMRAVFQHQPEVAHFYLGSRRHMMRRIFSDEQEPFWRSAKQMELGLIAPDLFAPYVRRRFEDTERDIRDEALERLLGITGGHPYATQELCYFLWQETPHGFPATPERLDAALAAVLRSEHAHFSLLWERASAAQRLVMQALAREPGRPLSGAYRHRHRLPGASTVQRALEALERQEIAAREDSEWRLAEPFLAQWLERLA
jgi:hypothetical protein